MCCTILSYSYRSLVGSYFELFSKRTGYTKYPNELVLEVLKFRRMPGFQLYFSQMIFLNGGGFYFFEDLNFTNLSISVPQKTTYTIFYCLIFNCSK